MSLLYYIISTCLPSDTMPELSLNIFKYCRRSSILLKNGNAIELNTIYMLLINELNKAMGRPFGFCFWYWLILLSVPEGIH